MNHRTASILGAGAVLILVGGLAAGLAGTAEASQLVYRPINPTFGGDPLNGNWLLSQGTAQQEGGGAGTPSFTIDFPDFSGVQQPPAVNPIVLPEVPTTPVPAPQ